MAALSSLIACASVPTTEDKPAAEPVSLPDPAPWSTLLAEARAEARQCGGDPFGAAQPLTLNARLAEAARAHSQDMARTGRMSHTGSRGQSLVERIEATGYQARAWGENVAAGYSDAESVVAAWLNSPGHCANIMDPEYRHFGVAMVRDGDGSPYWTLVLAAPDQ